ncbi:MAG: alpha/beta hydrolase fold domain-containing protein [Gemmatimonadaceae bacterium]
MRLLSIPVAVLVASCAVAQQPPRTFRDITYSTTSGIESKLDLYQNSSVARAAVLVYFHGGSWTTGERPKSVSSFKAFVALGFSVLSVDYRLSDVARAPAAVQDARCAVAWVDDQKALITGEVAAFLRAQHIIPGAP